MEPIKFQPILKQTIWGGGKIVDFKHIQGHSDELIGESWEISDVEGHESVAVNGPCKGMKLNEIVALLKEKLVGTDNYKRFGDDFPLLIKFIDASQDLSIQVHPDEETALRHGLKNGKTEMWYIMDSAPEAYLRCGLNSKLTPAQYKEMVEAGTICDAIASFPVKADDCFFIPAGRIHSIGSGCFLAEIQQTSDITYRIYDYNRKDANGKGRELHTALAKDAIDYKMYSDLKTEYTPRKNEAVLLADCPYFTTNLLEINNERSIRRSVADKDSFVIYICMGGNIVLSDNNGCKTAMHQGETVLVPASMEYVDLSTSESAKLLECYIPR